jgi:hypothetical protein
LKYSQTRSRFERSMTEPPRRGEKLDLYRVYKDEYRASRTPSLVSVGPALYLVVKGTGPPASPSFQRAIQSLYGAAYTLKFQHKARGRDFKVAGLEGIWGDGGAFAELRPEDWAKLPWRLVIRVPDFVTRADLDTAAKQLVERGKPGIGDVTLERLREGPCVQALHVGPYTAEWRTVEVMRRFVEDEGRSIRGPHHEIYLSDPRRVPPSRLRTILRYPLGKAHPSR